MAVQDPRLQDLNALLQKLTNRADTEYSSLVISIDLGTTYSGVAYIFTSDPERVYTIDQWPGASPLKIPSPKVPTVLKYGTGRPGFSWGYQVGSRDDKKVEAFKLLLDQDLPKPEYTQINKVQNTLREFEKTPADAVNDFMGALYRYAIATIEEKHMQEYAEILAVKFVVSSPAGWPGSVKSVILQAARDAGVAPITCITEAEAAVYFSMQSTKAKALNLKAGNVIMMCDAGGATTDLNCYTIQSLNPLKVVEFIPHLTRAAGSLNLNKNFENHIMKSVYEDTEFIQLKKSPLFVETIKQFEQDIKPVFVASNSRQFSVQLKGANLTDEPTGKLRNNTMSFNKADLERIFMPVANLIATCITEQINAVKLKKVRISSQDKTSVDAIILVGGFGGNKYLYEYLGSKFPSMKFIQPEDAWTAVIRGAARRYAPSKAVNIPVQPDFSSSSIRKATCHYGILCSPKCDDNSHQHEHEYWDSWEGCWRRKSINWLIKKGADLRRPQRFSLPFYKQCGPHPEGDDFFISINLEQSTAHEAPATSTHSSISTKKTIKISIDDIPDALFHKRTRNSDKNAYWQLFYEVVLDVDNGSIGFWIDINGTQFGRETIN